MARSLHTPAQTAAQNASGTFPRVGESYVRQAIRAIATNLADSKNEAET